MERIGRVVAKNRHDISGLLLRRYPRFILQGELSSDLPIPVFVFHDVTRSFLEPFLEYITRNRYRTLDADELAGRWSASSPAGAREIVLTFDDGGRSLWTEAFPLLKKYQCKAVAFICPGLLGDDDNWPGSQKNLCDWAHIRKMHESGLLDFQAHSLYHHTVFVSPRIVDFVSPFQKLSFLERDLFPISQTSGGIRFPDDLPIGTPIYRSAPRFSGKPRYIESDFLSAACVRFVAENGGTDFFLKANWRKCLHRFAGDLRTSRDRNGTFESPEQVKASLRHELKESRRILEFKIPGKKVRHFCYPWYTGCTQGVRASEEEGYLTNFWGGGLPGSTGHDCDVIHVPRFNPVYIWRLPGDGQRSLRQVVAEKYTGILRKKCRIRLSPQNG